jgi:hypothetical protein
MIKTVTSSSPHMHAAGSGASGLLYIETNPNNPLQGMLRLSGTDLEAFTGHSWTKISMSNADIGMNSVASSAIDWAIKKMREEMAWESLARENRTVKIALDNLEQARRQLDITAKLASNHETTS